MSEHDDVVEAFVRDVKSKRKYRHTCEDTIRDVIRMALPRHRHARSAVKAARATLHRVQAAYVGKHVIREHLDAVRKAHRAGDTDGLKRICLRLMADHASTRERIPLLDRFYGETFAITGVPRVILDVACGIHPLAIPWMGLPPDTILHAYEIAGDLVECLNAFLEGIDRPPLVQLRDVICTPPRESGDLAFLLKTVPCMERRQRGSAIRVIEGLNVRHVVVSFPVHSLSGRSKRMPEFYTSTFAAMVTGRNWRVTPVPLEGELAFVVDKKAPRG